MALYQYHALDALGKRKNGLIEAQSEKEAKEKLRDMGMMVIDVPIKTGVCRRRI